MGVVSRKVGPRNQLIELIYAVEGDDLDIYRKLIDKYQPNCPTCNTKLEVDRQTAQLAMSNPLMSQAGMDLATPLTYCQQCGARIVLPTICDIHSFPKFTEFITALRTQARRRGLLGG